MNFIKHATPKTMLVALAVVYATRACMSADPEMSPERSIKPDPEIQAQIRRTVKAIENDRPIAAQDELRRLDKLAGDGSRLVEQVGLYVKKLSGDEVMLGHLVLHPGVAVSIDIDDPAIVRGLAPFLNSEIGEFVEDEFSMIDNASPPLLPTPVSPPDYGSYKDFIEGKLHRSESIPEAFSEFIYQRAPDAAFLAFIYAHKDAYEDVHEESEPNYKDLLWAEHVISDAIWKKENNFDEAFDKSKPKAVEQLKKLSKHKKWWVRLYVAEIIRQHPELETPKLTERLSQDENQLVRQAITRPKPANIRRMRQEEAEAGRSE